MVYFGEVQSVNFVLTRESLRDLLMTILEGKYLIL